MKISIVDGNRQQVSIVPILKFCSSCREYKTPDNFIFDKRLELDLACYCRECNLHRGRKWAKSKPEKQKHYKLMARFGITYQDYRDMLIKQDYKCKICGTHEKDTIRKVLCVDHCHTSNRIRGLLCDNCNKGIGHFYDKPELLNNAIEYLTNDTHKIAI